MTKQINIEHSGITVEDFSLLPPEPLVSICCITYNHEKFIRDAIEGFLMQKTNFPFEIIIHDDASTDHTADILREYQEQHPELIRGIYQCENQHSQGKKVPAITYGMARGKYIAICEGDDYWTDPLKLQKQVDFMESHPECSISCHKVNVRYQDHEEKNHLFPDIEGDRILTREEIFQKYISATCSVVFRRLKIDELIPYLYGFYIGDIPLLHFFLELGNMGYLDDVMGVYRKNENSWWYPRQEMIQFPVLLDTYVKIRHRLRIRNSVGMNLAISHSADKILKNSFKKKDYKNMRKIILMSGFAFKSAEKHKLRRFIIYSVISFFPWLYSIYRSLRSSK